MCLPSPTLLINLPGRPHSTHRLQLKEVSPREAQDVDWEPGLRDLRTPGDIPTPGPRLLCAQIHLAATSRWTVAKVSPQPCLSHCFFLSIFCCSVPRTSGQTRLGTQASCSASPMPLPVPLPSLCPALPAPWTALLLSHGTQSPSRLERRRVNG